jgi:hypothetical protein
MALFAGTLKNGVWIRAFSDIFTIETDPDTLELEWNEGNTKPLHITTSVEWTLQGLIPAWLAVNKASGTGNDSLVFLTLKPNTTSASRTTDFFLFSPKAKTVTITVSQKGKTEGFGVAQEYMVAVFPNPNPGMIHIKSPFMIDKINLYSPLGECIKTIVQQATEYSIDMSDKPSGVYWISLFVNGKMFSRKIVLMQIF